METIEELLAAAEAANPGGQLPEADQVAIAADVAGE